MNHYTVDVAIADVRGGEHVETVSLMNCDGIADAEARALAVVRWDRAARNARVLRVLMIVQWRGYVGGLGAAQKIFRK